jgi:hypothetical protein
VALWMNGGLISPRHSSRTPPIGAPIEGSARHRPFIGADRPCFTDSAAERRRAITAAHHRSARAAPP